MNKLSLVTVVLLVLLVCGVAGISRIGSQPITINIQSTGFSPQKITVPQGRTVKFLNKDSEAHWPAANDHPVHLSYPEFDTQKPIGKDSEWQFSFQKIGKWTYHDHLNPELGGEIEVVSPNDFKNASFIEKTINSIKGFFAGKVSNSKLAVQSKNVAVFTCSNDNFGCIADYLEQITENKGPLEASKILNEYREEGKIEKSLDEHQLSHRIGRRTAASLGISAESFLKCPMADFNGGCQHGFFEFALGKSTTTKDAAETICESMVGKYSSKDHFYCYHGVGHGVMMAKAYNIDSSIKECELLGSNAGVNGCLQGAFMENGNALMRGEIVDKNPGDIIDSCNRVATKYQRECLINLSGHIVSRSGKDFDKAIKVCLSVDFEEAKVGCLNGLGLMVTNPVWQVNFFPPDSKLDHIQKSVDLCEKFPAEYINECVISGVANIQNFDNLELKRAKDFCDSFQDPLLTVCYTQIAKNVRNMAANKSQLDIACKSLNNNFTALCLKESDFKD